MSNIQAHFQVKHILDELRDEMSESEFGYRVQGLLAHVILRLSGRIIDIKPQGHPDIIAKLGSHKLLIEVKAVISRNRRSNFSLGNDDLEGIKPSGVDDVGYLAVLDCESPPLWILVEYNRLRRQLQGSINLVSLKAMANKKLSRECTQEFVNLVNSHHYHLRNLDFSILYSRALKGEQL